MLQHIDDHAFRPPALVDSDLARGCAVAVQRLAHFLRRQEKIGTAVVRHEKAEAVGMSLHRSGHQIDLGDNAELSFAIGHQLTVARHRCDALVKRLAFFVSVHAE